MDPLPPNSAVFTKCELAGVGRRITRLSLAINEVTLNE